MVCVILARLGSHISACHDCFTVKVIDVDIEYPERNGEFLVVSVPNIDYEEKGILHDAYNIIYKGGRIFEYFKDEYSAELVSESEILFTLPSTPSGYLHEFEQVWERQKQTDDFIPEMKQAHNLLRNAIASDPDRATKQVVLRFPSHVRLTQVPFAKENETTLPCEIESIKKTEDMFGKSVVRTTDYIMWPVGIVETDVRRANDVPAPTSEPRGAARLRERMARMSTTP